MKSIFVAVLFLLLPYTLFAQTDAEAQALHDRGKECLNSAKVAEGREYTRQAMEMRKELFGEVN